jgi:hypothetical protein
LKAAAATSTGRVAVESAGPIHALGWLFFVLAGPPLSKVKLY